MGHFGEGLVWWFSELGKHHQIQRRAISPNLMLAKITRCTAILWYNYVYIPYSLKFSRLKIFADFVGQRMVAKIFFREISST